MTAGSDPLIARHHPMHPRDDRESLSALFDGQLPGDAARFALKRLDHDLGWRDLCGRWLLIGDALRGQATGFAPADFAAGVTRALAAERKNGASAMSIEAAPGPALAAAASRRRWIGGAALAASMAMAAVLVVRPFSQQQVPAPATQVAAGTTQPETTAAPAMPAAEQAIPRANPPQTSIALTQVPKPIATRPDPRDQRARAARRVQRGLSSGGSSAATAQTAVATASPARPFHPPPDEIITRPWPRAALPGATANGSLTVDLESGSAPLPSFYPFEPHPAAEQSPAEPQR